MTPESSKEPDPVAGALLGLAAGDVLGAPVEGMGPVAAAAALSVMPEAPYTDDTQQALVIAYHLLERNGIAPEELADAFVALALPIETWGVYRGIGPGFRAFVAHRLRGSEGPAAQPSAGNGAAMRVAPIAIRFHAARHELVEQAMAASMVTHSDPVGIAAACAIAGAVAAAGEGESGPGLVRTASAAALEAEEQLMDDYSELLSSTDQVHLFSEALSGAVSLVGGDPAAAASEIGRRASRTSAHGPEIGTAPYAPASVVTAIVIAADDRPAAELIRRAVALGGDADTVGAMTGAIAAAREGTVEWPWPIVNAEVIAEVGRRLAKGSAGTEGLPGLYDLEARTGASIGERGLP